MMLGKRSRAPGPMKRTTSMTGITVDSLDPNITDETMGLEGHPMVGPTDHRSYTLLSPRYYSSEPAAAVHRLRTANFLRTCGLCNRRLVPGRDIYMYRGDTAFCSQECREQQMKQDERKELNATAGSEATSSTGK